MSSLIRQECEPEMDRSVTCKGAYRPKACVTNRLWIAWQNFCHNRYMIFSCLLEFQGCCETHDAWWWSDGGLITTMIMWCERSNTRGTRLHQGRLLPFHSCSLTQRSTWLFQPEALKTWGDHLIRVTPARHQEIVQSLKWLKWSLMPYLTEFQWKLFLSYFKSYLNCLI